MSYALYQYAAIIPIRYIEYIYNMNDAYSYPSIDGSIEEFLLIRRTFEELTQDLLNIKDLNPSEIETFRIDPNTWDMKPDLFLEEQGSYLQAIGSDENKALKVISIYSSYGRKLKYK